MQISTHGRTESPPIIRGSPDNGLASTATRPTPPDLSSGLSVEDLGFVVGGVDDDDVVDGPMRELTGLSRVSHHDELNWLGRRSGQDCMIPDHFSEKTLGCRSTNTEIGKV